MAVIEKIKNIKTYDELCLMEWYVGDDEKERFENSRYEHPIFFLGKYISKIIYKNIKDIHDFNEFNIEYKNQYKNKGIDISVDKYRYIAELYLLKYDIDDIYRYTIKTTIGYLIHYNNYVVSIVTIVNNRFTIEIIYKYNYIIMQRDSDINISELVIDMRMKKLEYIKSL